MYEIEGKPESSLTNVIIEDGSIVIESHPEDILF